MFNGKNKAITFSYDDGVMQDVRLVEIFNKHGLKGTFNLNSGLLDTVRELDREGRRINHTKVRRADLRSIYAGHEIAAHTLTHPLLPSLPDDEVVRQVEEDRLALSELAGYEVVGMAYPCGGQNNDERVRELVRTRTGIRYARDIVTTGSFALPTDLWHLQGTVYHHGEWNKLYALADAFFAAPADTPAVFYIWGHSYEFDIYPERWEQFDEFCRYISGRADVFYGTNREVLLR